MRLYGWEFLAVCHQPDKFDDHRHFDGGYLMVFKIFLIFNDI